MATTALCRVCEKWVPVTQHRLLKRHDSLSDPDLYCEGSLKPINWAIAVRKYEHSPILEEV
jgi:hypothetical protein